MAAVGTVGSEPLNCPICFDPMDHLMLVATRCTAHHFFHLHCMDQQTVKICALCREVHGSTYIVDPTYLQNALPQGLSLREANFLLFKHSKCVSLVDYSLRPTIYDNSPRDSDVREDILLERAQAPAGEINVWSIYRLSDDDSSSIAGAINPRADSIWEQEAGASLASRFWNSGPVKVLRVLFAMLWRYCHKLCFGP